MYEGRLILAQLMDFIPKRDFDDSVNRYRGNYRVRDFSCRDQFLAMAFAQLTSRESLRDIETCLNAVQPKLYHAGFRGRVSRSTLGDANKRRDWRIYVLVAILKRELKLDHSLTEILQILSVTPFEKTAIFQALSTSFVPNPETTCCNQSSLFDL